MSQQDKPSTGSPIQDIPKSFPFAIPPSQPRRRLGSEGAIEIPRNFTMSKLPSSYQHMRTSSANWNTNLDVGNKQYGYSVSPLGSPTLASASLSSSPLSPVALHRRASIGSVTDGCPDKCVCARHHHRNSAVAVKFGSTFAESPFEEEEAVSNLAAQNGAYAQAMRRHSSVATLNRPPTPISERILKGDFNF